MKLSWLNTLLSQGQQKANEEVDLQKAPVEYTPDHDHFEKKIPASKHPVISKVQLPNGLIYQQHERPQGVLGPSHIHHLYHPDHENPVA